MTTTATSILSRISMHHEDASPWLARGLHLFGLALILTALIDLTTTVWPLRPSELAWRYGFLGLAAGYLQTPTLGLLLMSLTAGWREDYGLMRLTSTVMLVLGVVLLPVTGLFLLDVLQMRGLRPPEAQAGVLYGGAFQAVKYAVAALVLLILGFGGVKTARTGKAGAGRRPSRPGIVSAKG